MRVMMYSGAIIVSMSFQVNSCERLSAAARMSCCCVVVGIEKICVIYFTVWSIQVEKVVGGLQMQWRM